MNFQGLDFDPMNPEETMPNGKVEEQLKENKEKIKLPF